MGVLLKICCIFSEHLFLGTPLGGCFSKLGDDLLTYILKYMCKSRKKQKKTITQSLQYFNHSIVLWRHKNECHKFRINTDKHRNTVRNCLKKQIQNFTLISNGRFQIANFELQILDFKFLIWLHNIFFLSFCMN